MIMRKETGIHGTFLRFAQDLGTSVKVDTFEYDGDDDTTEVCGVTVDDYLTDLQNQKEDVDAISERIGDKLETLDFLTNHLYSTSSLDDIELEMLEKEFSKAVSELSELTIRLTVTTGHIRKEVKGIRTKCGK